jgi:hypothetical protein
MAANRAPGYDVAESERDALTSNSSVPGFALGPLAHRSYGSTTRCVPCCARARGAAGRGKRACCRRKDPRACGCARRAGAGGSGRGGKHSRSPLTLRFALFCACMV